MTDTWGIASVAAITVICYLLGMACKASERVKDTLIPSIMGVFGAALGIIAYATKMPEFADFHVLTAIAVGIVSGLAATGVNQIYKQSNKEDWE
jgi:hypothetical protein